MIYMKFDIDTLGGFEVSPRGLEEAIPLHDEVKAAYCVTDMDALDRLTDRMYEVCRVCKATIFEFMDGSRSIAITMSVPEGDGGTAKVTSSYELHDAPTA